MELGLELGLDCDWDWEWNVFFPKIMLSGDMFHDILRSQGYFLIDVCVFCGLWTCLASWRVHGGDIGEMHLSMGALLAPFRLPFLMKIASFFMCCLIAFLDAMFINFYWFWECFLGVV